MTYKMSYVDLPIYEPVGNLILIGTNHGADGVKSHKKKKLLEIVLDSDHLIMEGNSRSNKVNQELGETNYEMIAVNNFQGPIHYLEEELHFRQEEILEKYGIRKDLLEIYDLFLVIPTTVQMSKSPDHFLELLGGYLNIRKQLNPAREEMDLNSIVRIIPEIFYNFSEALQVICEIGSIFLHYFARLREYELLGPKIVEFNAILEGKKAVMVGAGHVKYLAKCLRGEKVKPPQEWRDFVEKLEPQYRESIGKIENDIFPKPTS